METSAIEAQQKYYEEIQDCIRLENLAYYIQNQNNRISVLQSKYRDWSMPNIVWGIVIITLFAAWVNDFSAKSLKAVAYGVGWVIVAQAYNRYNDKKIRTEEFSVAEDRDEKQEMYNSLYADIEARFVNGEFSINKDCWHCGNELMQYFNENRAFSFKEAIYYVDKRRDREAMERGLRNAYNSGYSSGNAAGYNSGYAQGKSAGYSQGKNAGRSDGYASGVRDGYFMNR